MNIKFLELIEVFENKYLVFYIIFNYICVYKYCLNIFIYCIF